MFRVLSILLLILPFSLLANIEASCTRSEHVKFSSQWVSDFLGPKISIESHLPNDLSLSKPKVILIIDDMGDNFRLGRRVIELPVAVNLSILPHTPFGKKLAELGHERGHDVMLHFPMEATTRPDLLGKGSLTLKHNQFEAKAIFEQNLQQVPFVKGFNNHMGSRLTKSKPHMEWLMSVALEKELYFVDSRTISDSLAQHSAKRAGVAALGRDVFLDPVVGEASVEQQLRKALNIADERGQVVVIGHPFAETLDVLERQLPELTGVYSFVTVSEYFARADTDLATTISSNAR